MSIDPEKTSAHLITVDGPKVSRTVSIGDIRAYMKRKGFWLANRQGERPTGCELHYLAETVEAMTPGIDLFDENDNLPEELRRVVAQIARCLARPRAEVLREIAGEVVTLEDAWGALDKACVVCGIARPADLSRDPRYLLGFVRKSADLGMAARDYIAMGPTVRDAPGYVDRWKAVARAAEDLAAIALEHLRAERCPPMTEALTS